MKFFMLWYCLTMAISKSKVLRKAAFLPSAQLCKCLDYITYILMVKQYFYFHSQFFQIYQVGKHPIRYIFNIVMIQIPVIIDSIMR